MAKKFTKEFNADIRRILDNYNKKVSRLEAKYPTSRRIPPHISAKSLKIDYPRKNDLQKKLKQLESFNEEKMHETVFIKEGNFDTNKYQHESFMLNKKVALNKLQHLFDANRKKDQEEGRFFMSSRTKALKGQIKTLQQVESEKFNYQKYLAARNIASRYSDGREKSDQQFYENFFDMLWANQIYAELDPDMVQNFHDMVEQLTPEQLLEMYNREPDVSRLVEDYNLYVDSQGYSITDEEVFRARVRFEALYEEMPELIKKYSKM